MPQKQVRYGIIGCGAIGQRRHIPEAAANPNAVVAALADPVKERVEELARKYNAQPFTNYKQLLAKADVDAVVVCGPNALHARQTIDAFRAGKHVLVEKPMACTRAEAREKSSRSAHRSNTPGRMDGRWMARRVGSSRSQPR
jgi:UDP-N-acetylglucosamine 3-dehydrogenase